MKKTISSPLCKNSMAIEIKAFNSEYIISNYKKEFAIDVSEFFNDVREFSLYQCEESGYSFFYPYMISGNARFYEQLENFSWYYSPSKWEHKIVLELLEGNEDILEVGCGNGNFLKQAVGKTTGKKIGLEINANSIMKGDAYEILNQSIAEHALRYPENYDIVCTFQVLEHISEVYEFISNQLTCLKKNGRLVVAVPNNNSFIKEDSLNMLNNPPHHMGLWNETSLMSLASIFDITFEKCIKEPLQEIHFQWYNRIILSKYVGKTGAKIITKIGFLCCGNLLKAYYRKKSMKIEGHTILFIYKKN